MWLDWSLRCALIACLLDSEPAAPAQAGAGRFADQTVVASAFDSKVTWKDLEPLILGRHAWSKEGRDALQHLVKTRMLELLEKEQGLQVTQQVIDARCAEIEAQVHASGEKDGLEAHLRRARLTRAEFRQLLELAVVQETLTRRALGKRDNEEVTSEQQELWLDEVLQERGLVLLKPPWPNGVAARATGMNVPSGEFLIYLRRSLPPETIRQDCYELLLLQRVRARMPDLAPEKLARYVDEELEQRRTGFARDPKVKGISWEQWLEAQGVVPGSMRDDPSVHVAALARLWIERSYDEPTLKRVYGEEREHFESLYGAAIDVRMIFLRGTELPRGDDLRSFKDSEARLSALQKKIRTLEDFQRSARETSEDAQTRENGGALGYVTVGNPRVAQAVRDVVRKELEEHPTLAASSDGALHGPLRLPNGVALLWLGARRPAPSWAEMQFYVRRELRQRFLDEALPRSTVVDALVEK